MMIKMINTSIAILTMFTLSKTVAIAQFTKYNFIVLRGKYYFFIMFTPFVIVYHAVGRVNQSGKYAADGEDDGCCYVEGKKKEVV